MAAIILKRTQKKVGQMPFDQFIGWIAEQELNADDYQIILSDLELRQIIRDKIRAKAGDTLSLLGTTSDATQFLMFEFFTLIVKLSEVYSDSVKEATHSILPIAKAFLEKVENGEVQLPYQAKGLEQEVMPEIEQRATAVTQALQSAPPGD